MIFKAVDGFTLSLEILDYQFPENDYGMYDSNWLMLRIIATNPGSTWETVDPCMDTYGAENLYRWFTQIADGNIVRLILSTGYIEGIDFAVSQITEHVHLTVKNRYYRVIDDRRHLFRSTYMYQIELHDFKAAIEQWGLEIQKFPTRVNRH
jgi:hypothetical protein